MVTTRAPDGAKKPVISDADNTCKLPFFYNGVWFENCTLAPKDDYWCPTGKYSKLAQYVDNFLLI